jgi:hypothetical protein
LSPILRTTHLTEVRWDAELCPGCELEWLPPGSALFIKVCARCYASASSGRAVDPESVKMDVKVIGKIRGPLTPGLSMWFVVGASWMTVCVYLAVSAVWYWQSGGNGTGVRSSCTSCRSRQVQWIG